MTAQHNYSIRRLVEGDAQALRSLRLFALRETPAAFGISYDEEKEKPLQKTEKDIQKDILFSAFDDKGRMIAVACCHGGTLRKLAHKGHLYGMYVRPEERGKGVMSEVLSQLVCISLQRYAIILATVIPGNEPALRCLGKRGFTPYCTEEKAMLADRTYYDLVHLRLERTPDQAD